MPARLDELIAISNPVWGLRRLQRQLRDEQPDWAPLLLREAAARLIQQGARIPPRSIEELLGPQAQGALSPARPPESGVIGLVCDSPLNPTEGFVVPLTAARSSSWYVDPVLPFSEENLCRLLSRLVHCSGAAVERSLPERLAFKIGLTTSLPIEGTSMDVAALMACVGAAANSWPDLLNSACAVVEPAGVEGTALRPVGGVAQKLEGFRRERLRGSLLVRHEDCLESTAFLDAFDTVWSVGSIEELASRLRDAGLLQPFVKAARLSPTEFQMLESSVFQRQKTHDYLGALDLGRRVLSSEHDDWVSNNLRRSVKRVMCRAARFLWRHAQARRLAEELLAESRQRPTDGRLTLDRASVATDCVQLAACLDLTGDHVGMADLLEPWRLEIDRDPGQFPFAVRVHALGTLARARSCCGRPGWEALFEHAIGLSANHDLEEECRTRIGFAGELLRHGALDAAEKELERCEELAARSRTPSEFTRSLIAFERADLARRRGRLWTDARIEALRSRGDDLPVAYYFQATARQVGRDPGDSAKRLDQAASRLMRHSGPTDLSSSRTLVAAMFDLLAAGIRTDEPRWNTARSTIGQWFDVAENAGWRAFYAPAWARVTQDIGRGSAEGMLDCTPRLNGVCAPDPE